jgi:asparagine synthase (glutamine-hydrolysing)
LAETLGPWSPAWAWTWIRRVRRGDDTDIFGYCAINPDRFETLDLSRRARQAGNDLAGRPWKDGFEERVWCLERCDSGDSLKGGLAEYRLDVREPLADVRLIEFCLSVPTSQFLRDGTPRALARRALADRLPRLVLENERTGVDSADWHERLTAARHEVATELERLAECAPAARAVDLPRLRRLVQNWPTTGWERPEVRNPYRLALLRAISTGHFLRRVTGGNE